MNKNVAIIGGSMAGLFTALLLEKCGFHVTIYEKSKQELSGRGAGIIIHPPLLAALDIIGISEAQAQGVPLEKRQLFSPTGEVVMTKDYPQLSSSWERLFKSLRARVPNEHYLLNHQLEAFEQTKEGVTLRFTNGNVAEADLLIGADGLRSQVRQLLLPTIKPHYAGYIAWRGMVEEALLSPQARAALMAGFSFCLPPNQQFLGYPVAGANDQLKQGERRFNYVWYQKIADAALKSLLTDAEGNYYEEGIPPPKITPQNREALKAQARDCLAPFMVEAVALSPMPFFQQIYDVAVPQMVFGRAVLLGDAAFVARPHVGAGVTKAAEDALALHQALSQIASPSAALAQFEQERLAQGHKIITQARFLGANMSHASTVLAQTASSQYLQG